MVPLKAKPTTSLSYCLVLALAIFAFCTLQRISAFSSVTIIRGARSGSFPRYHITLMSADDNTSVMTWTPLDPSDFDKGCASPEANHRLAKDENYLNAVLKVWKKEFSFKDTPVEMSSLTYKDSGDNALYGLVVRSVAGSTSFDPKPGVLLFHTAAGPSDIFLFYKASLLAREGCVVLICDILSDATGWGWDADRTRYNKERGKLASDDHRLLLSRVEAAMRALTDSSSLNVDRSQLAAMGWCLGGQPILEIPRIHIENTNVRAMVTFHGVFRRNESLPKKSTDKSVVPDCRVLLCNGKEDPFVSQQDLKDTNAYFEASRCKVEILELDAAKHGFTNPAQAYNENDSFNYNEAAADKAWESAVALLKDELLP